MRSTESTEEAAEPVVSISPNIRDVPIFVNTADNTQLREIASLIDSGHIIQPIVAAYTQS